MRKKKIITKSILLSKLILGKRVNMHLNSINIYDKYDFKEFLN